MAMKRIEARVRLECFGRSCVVLKEGPQQSEIQFADDRSTRFVVNEWLETYKSSESIEGRVWEKRFKGRNSQ